MTSASRSRRCSTASRATRSPRRSPSTAPGCRAFADSWGYKIEAYDAIPYNVAILVRHGVLTTINSDDDGRARRLNIDAAKMVRYGALTEDEALKIITYNGAVQLGLENRVGSIEVGKEADVVLWNAHPLSVYASPDYTFIDGELFFSKAMDAEHRASARRRAHRAREGRTESGPERPRRRRWPRWCRDSPCHALEGEPLMRGLIPVCHDERGRRRCSRPRRSRPNWAPSIRVPARRGRSRSAMRESSRSAVPEIANGTLVISGGKITAVGANAGDSRRRAGDRRHRPLGLSGNDGRRQRDRALGDSAGRQRHDGCERGRARSTRRRGRSTASIRTAPSSA